MCNSLTFEGKEFWTPRQLAELLGGEDRLVWASESPFRNLPEGRDWQDLDLCLCAIELEATLEKASLSWRPGSDPMVYFAWRPE